MFLSKTFMTNGSVIEHFTYRKCFFKINEHNASVYVTWKGKILSVDSISSWDQFINYRTDFLNIFKTRGIALHNLLQKLKTPSMLIRNLDTHKLCNGTRLIMSHLLEATIMLGKYGGVHTQNTYESN